jgi:DUF971 family protein
MVQPPEDIKARRADRLIEIRWSADDTRTYPARALRCVCSCAECVDENTGVRTLDPNTVPQDITVESMQLVGNYALKIFWTDGHSTGIYTWEFLRGLPAGATQ